MSTLNPKQVNNLVSLLPELVRLQLHLKGPRICVAGGFILSNLTDSHVNDIDLFTTDKETALEVATALAGKDGYIETKNAFTIIRADNPTIQIIHRWTFAHPIEVIGSFDFTVSSAAFWWEPIAPDCLGHWASACHPTFYSDMFSKRLVYTSPIRLEQTGGSLLRILKFCKRGFDISAESLAAVVARTVQNIKDESATNVETEKALGSTLSKHLSIPGRGGSDN